MSLHGDRGVSDPRSTLTDRLTGHADLSRRDLLKAVGAGALALAGSGVLDACGQLGASSSGGVYLVRRGESVSSK